LISNINCHGASTKYPSILSGVPGHMIEDIKISDVYIDQLGGGAAEMATIDPPEKADAYPDPAMFGPLPATGFFIRHARNIEMSNIEIATQEPDRRPAFWLRDVEGADFFRLRVPQAAPSFALDSVKDFRVFGSLRIKDTILDTVDKKTI
jgi:polygalacturonase